MAVAAAVATADAAMAADAAAVVVAEAVTKDNLSLSFGVRFLFYLYHLASISMKLNLIRLLFQFFYSVFRNSL